MRLSVVVASMNEAQSIAAMIDEIRKFTPKDTEILLIDSSSDETPRIAQAKGARVISEPPKGHGMALKHGLHQASGDIIVTTDCDLTYPMERIPEFVDLITKEKYDLISGCRMTSKLKREMPFFNKLANLIFAFLVRVLYSIDTHDVSTGMLALKREYARTDWLGNFSLPAEIIIRSRLLNKKYKEIPIDYKFRVGETTLNKWRSGRAYLRCFFYWKFGWFKNREL